MKKSRSKRPSYKKLNQFIILISVAVFGLFIYRKMAISPVEINQITFVDPSRSPSPTPTSTQYPKPSPVSTTPPPPPSPAPYLYPSPSATSLPLPVATSDPSASITCQAQIYKIPFSGASPKEFDYYQDLQPYLTTENKRSQSETVKAGEYYLIYPRIDNITSYFLSTKYNHVFRSTPRNNAQSETTLVAHGDYYSYVKNKYDFVYLNKLQIHPNNGVDHTSAYFVYYVRPGRDASFRFYFDLVGPNILGSSPESCGSLLLRRQK